MTTRISSPNNLTEAIERRIIESGADGLTYNVVMDEMQIGRTCARGHITMLEDLGRIYRVRRTNPYRGPLDFPSLPNRTQAAPFL